MVQDIQRTHFWHYFFTFAELSHLFFIHGFMNNIGKHSRACFWPTLVMVSPSSPPPALLAQDWAGQNLCSSYSHRCFRTASAILEQAEFLMAVLILRCLHLLHRHIWLFLLAHVRSKAIITQLLSLPMNANYWSVSLNKW